MNKKIYYLLILCLGIITFSFVSCGDDDDTKIDEEWKVYQDTEFNKVAANKAFTEIKSENNNGSVYWQPSEIITDSDLSTRISAQGTPNFTDTVVVRYEGWYFDLQGKKYIFDSTENPSTGSTVNPNKKSVQFSVNQVIVGWTTLLQDMKVGDEREVCIPQQLAYGASGTTSIPAYTTLWFRVKLLNIISMKGLK